MIDFTKIRGDTVEGQRSSFEQLVCHLARLDNTRGGEFRRIQGSGGDGGVEALRILHTDKKVGYQAKYFPSRKDINWRNLEESVKTALAQHPELKCYVIALPCDFTGTRTSRGGSTDGIWGKWDTQIAHWKNHARAAHMNVEFEVWTAFELERALLQPEAQHLIRFFFDRLTFSREWLRRHLNRTIADLQARYSPDEHVDTEGLKPFDVVYRREHLRTHLKGVFEIARSANPRAGAALMKEVVVFEAEINKAETAQKDFLALEDAVDLGLTEAWPVCEWLTTWHSLMRRLIDLVDCLWVRSGTKPTEEQDALNHRMMEMIAPHKLMSAQVFGGPWMDLLPIDGARAILFTGSAGIGKSHVLARGSEMAWSEGVPVVHLLGQYLLEDDPRTSILKRLELTNWSFYEALTALDLAAEAKKTRALLIIDALNEGRGTEVWRKHLGTFVREVNEHKHIMLAVSCRAEYLEYVVPSEIIAHPEPYPNKETKHVQDCAPLGKLVHLHVRGFRTIEEREKALHNFMDKKGIARPTAPMLDREFFNPLVMSSICRSMAKAGMKVFPQGLHGARETFRFVLETKAKALGTRHDGTERVYRALLAALDGLARSMVQRGEDKVALHDAAHIIELAFEALPISDQSWLDVLEGSDILRRDVEPSNDGIHDWSKPHEVIRFSFQRLQDNLIAERLISQACSIDIEDAFETYGPFAFLVRESTENGITSLEFNSPWIGTLAALWAGVAETHGKELYDLRSFFGDRRDRREVQEVFRASIRERDVSAFTSRTKEILDYLWKDEPETRLAILLSNSCVPGHKWNAEFLISRLASLSASQRASDWSHLFEDRRCELNDRAAEVIDWALQVDVTSADAEVVRLAGLTLTCLITVVDSKISGRATEALANLLSGAPSLRKVLQQRIEKADGWSLPQP